MINKFFGENLLKGRIAECIVEEMFKEAGYKVYRFGYENILQNLTQTGVKMNKSDTLDKIKEAPDLIVVDDDGNVDFIEVKFRTEAKNVFKNKRKHENLSKHWGSSYIFLVSLDERIFNILSLSKEWTGCFPLLPNAPFKLNKEVIDKYKKLVIRYLDKKE